MGRFDSDGTIDAETYITESGTGVKVGALITTVITALAMALGGFWIAIIEAVAQFHVGLISGLGTFLARLITEFFGESAGLVVASWRAALVQAIQYGPLAPLLLALEAVTILLIVIAIWRRVPYV